MCHPDVDFTRTVSNDIIEMLQALGIEAARNALLKELRGAWAGRRAAGGGGGVAPGLRWQPPSLSPACACREPSPPARVDPAVPLYAMLCMLCRRD